MKHVRMKSIDTEILWITCMTEKKKIININVHIPWLNYGKY